MRSGTCKARGGRERHGRTWWEAAVLEGREEREPQNANSLYLSIYKKRIRNMNLRMLTDLCS